MLNTNEKIIKHKVGLLNLAEELGNVSKACQVMGMSRDTFYRYKSAVDDGGVEALFERTRRKPNLANRVRMLSSKTPPISRPTVRPAHPTSCANWGCLSRHPACVRSGYATIWPISSLA